MFEHKKPEVETGRLNVDEGIGDEYQLKSNGNLSEENQRHDMKANTGDQKTTNWTFIVANRNNYEIGSYSNELPIFFKAHEIDQSIVIEDNGNTHQISSGDCYNKRHVSVDHEHDDGVVSGDDDNDTVTEDHEHDDSVVSGDDNNGTVTENHEHDDGVLSGDDDNDIIGKDYRHEDGVESGNDKNDTVPEEHDLVNTFFVNDEEDIAFSFKNLFSCIGGKAKNKDKSPYVTLNNDKEKQPPINLFRQTQSMVLKTANKHANIPSHPNIKTLTCYEVHNSGINGASANTLVQSGQTITGNIHTGKVHAEDFSGGGHLVNNRDVAHNCIDPDQYDFTHPHRGYAVLIVNQHFSRLDARNGADVDVQNTKMVLQKLGFFMKNEQLVDLDKQSALAVLRDAKDSDHSRMDSFAFVISSHGNEIENPRNGKKEHAIYCSDDQYIFTNDILEMFSDENCPSLKGKPKLFFIQACRGANTDSGVEIITVDGRNSYQNYRHVHNSSYHDGKNLDRVLIEPIMNAESNPLLGRVQRVDDMDAKSFEDISDDRPIVHCNNDCLVMYAIPSGYFAWRSNMDGSWMLHYLWEEVMNYNFRKPCSFLKVLTAVTRKMSQRETNVPDNEKKSGKKAIPVIIHQLDKDIVFQEK
ncbi:hypothetical protein CHS0354_031360 [Potamilus streckersoni]|uniref:Uncharacterized protein n=1 Tax=Potamilus streckersoni TaxID=2493646 RepID=A0AAE0SJS3_9BIVA|nr:hypothetical protein CHS0354_031360 [Potamilus streckersoni]